MPYDPPPLPTYTFANGITVSYRPLSAFFLNKLRAQVDRRYGSERPEPPVMKTDFGEAPNTQDAAFIADLNAYLQKIGTKILHAAIETSVVVDASEIARGLAAWDAEKAAYEAYLWANGLTDVPSDYDSYAESDNDLVRYIVLSGAAGNSLELVRFMQALYGQDGSMEARVKMTREAFQSDVSPNGHLAAASPALGD